MNVYSSYWTTAMVKMGAAGSARQVFETTSQLAYHTSLLFRTECKMYLRRFVQRHLTCLSTEGRALWLHAHSRQSIPTQNGMTTIGEAWRQDTTLETAARDCQALVNIVPTHGRSLTAPCELGPARSTFCHPTGVTVSHPFGTCLSVVI
jgi:hypothetical protein